ncbi:MAG TPA: 4-hydroxy-tetrahydrodipicolinate reductase [Methanosarcinales archaeon]|nr:4-hydroxy-tetrahydrodipicolinate reductase [Methanosarcinales archaeon]
MINIAVTGACGRMGSLIIDNVLNTDDMQLVAAFDVINLGKTIKNKITVLDANYIIDLLKETSADVLIDFTIAEGAVNNIKAASANQVNLVVGTTGFTPQQQKEIQSAVVGKVAAVISPNFSIGVNVFWKLLANAVKYLKEYDIEIIEAHHKHKKDAPSGTAKKAAEIINSIVNNKELVYGRVGESLRGNEIGIHAIRGGDIVGDHTVLFAGDGERIEIKHQAHSRQAFASGAIKAARWVVNAEPGLYSMDDVLF